MKRLLLGVLACAAALPSAAQAATPKPFGALDCPVQEGVRFCEGRVATFDGVPLDVNVTLPAGGEGGFPLVILSHGWGGAKMPLAEADRANVSGSSLPWAQRGYAVLSITSRGFNGSCGRPESRIALGCDHGWIRLDDTRFEIRDAQHLAGMLVDDGLVDPARIGVHGGSYGGGVSNAMAMLRNRIMQPDGSYAPWVSPTRKVPISLAASAPYIPWSDLVYSLVPNGRTLDYAEPRTDESRRPFGVAKQSFVSGLFALGATSGFYAPPGADPQADLTTWFARINAGEPYEGDAQLTALADEIYTHHSSISIDRSVPPAPIFLASGWTDDLFPADEALRLRNAIVKAHPSTPLALMFFDFGHQRGTGRPEDVARYRRHVVAWMDRHVRGDAAAPAPTGVETLTQTCPNDAPAGGPFHAASWPEIRGGEVRHSAAGPFTLTNGGGDPQVAQAIDPIAGGGDACAKVSAEDESGTVNIRFPAARGQGYTLMGAPTLIVEELTASSPVAQVAARLWDVAPDGQQTLVARSVYRPDATGRQVFQLHPNGWRFAPGHVAKLQLLGRDAPYARASNGAFTVGLRDVQVRLPVVERDGPDVRAPLPYVLPAGATLAPGFAGAVALPVSARGKARKRVRLRLVVRCRTARVRGRAVKRVRRVRFTRMGMRRRVDRKRPFRVRLAGGGRRVRAVAVLRGGRTVRLRAAVPRRCRR